MGIGLVCVGWMVTAAASWTPTAPMPDVARDHLMYVLPDGRVAAVGTGSWSSQKGSALYDPATKTWSAGASVSSLVQAVAAPLGDGRALFTNGSDAELYDPADSSFRRLSAQPLHPRVFPAVAPLRDGRVLIFGGRIALKSGVAVTAAELFNPATGQFEEAGTTPEMPSATGVLLDSGRVLAVTGGSDSWQNRAALFEPESRTWTPTGSHPSTFPFATLVALCDGGALQVGGVESTTYPGTAHTFRFDGNTRTWAASGDMASRRLNPAVVLLPDCRVLVSGGSSGDSNPGIALSDAEVWDPATGNWSPAGEMTERRSGHRMVVLGTDTVLAAGGWNSDVGELRSAELLDLASLPPPSSSKPKGGCASAEAPVLSWGLLLLLPWLAKARRGTAREG